MSLVTVFLLLLFYNMLRIECVLIDRRLSRAFGADKRKLKDILSKRAIEIMCVEYKKIFIEDMFSSCGWIKLQNGHQNSYLFHAFRC